MKELRRLLFVVAAAAFFIGLFVLCDNFADDVVEEYSSDISPSLLSGSSSGKKDGTATIDDVNVQQKVEDMVEADNTADMKLTVAGEIMCQNQQLEQAYDEEKKSFSFADGLKYLKDDLSSGDITVSTLGTTLAGSGNGYSSTTGGYCAEDGMYNSPEVLASDLKNAGITLLNTATSHSLDSGINGVYTTIDNLDKAKLKHVGTAKTSSDSKDYILKNNYVKIAFTGYTENTNEQKLPDNASFAVNTLDSLSDTKVADMCTHISELQKNNDYVIVMLNFGTADSSDIESSQESLAEKLAKAGADVIIGTGSRAIKPMEVMSVTDDNGLQHSCTVFYGLGAVYSSDYYSEYENLDTDISLILQLNLRSSISGTVELTDMKVIPVYLNWNNGLVQPVPVCEAKDTSKYSSVLDDDDKSRIESAYSGAVAKLLNGTSLKSEYNKKDYSYSVSLNK